MTKDRKFKQNKWIKPRHKFARNLIFRCYLPYVKRKYHVNIEKFANQGDRQYLILLNHQTAFDQFLVGGAFDGPVYYVATEDIFTLGFLSKIIKFFVAPIPIKKQATDVSAVLTCKRIVKEGGTIAVMPEGNRTYSGETVNINPAIVGLAKLLKLPIVFFRIEGGYGVHPRWSDAIRKTSSMRAYVSRVMEVEEYINLDNDALYDLIKTELYVDETKVQGEYTHKNLAEYLERVLYVCPNCGLAEFVTKKDEIECKKCHLKAKYLPNKQFKVINGNLPFTSVKDWYNYQNEYINNLDLSTFNDNVIFEDKKVKLFNVFPYKRKCKLSKVATITAYNDKIVLAYKKQNILLPLDEISVATVLGKNKLNVYCNDKVYQIKGDKRFNALKYVNLYYHYKNEKGGDKNGRFLGL